MLVWIKRSARIVAMLCFFILFFLGLDPQDVFNPDIAIISFLKAAGLSMLVWIVAFVLADMLFKGILEDIELKSLDALEEGIAQRLREEKRNMSIEPPEVQRITDPPELKNG